MKKTYHIDVDCANCANKMEAASVKIAGVAEVTVNFMAQKLNITFAEGADVEAVMAQVRKACKKVDSDCEIYL